MNSSSSMECITILPYNSAYLLLRFGISHQFPRFRPRYSSSAPKEVASRLLVNMTDPHDSIVYTLLVSILFKVLNFYLLNISCSLLYCGVSI